MKADIFAKNTEDAFWEGFASAVVACQIDCGNIGKKSFASGMGGIIKVFIHKGGDGSKIEDYDVIRFNVSDFQSLQEAFFTIEKQINN